MRLEVNTAEFKELLSKARYGSSNNPLLPLSCMISISLKNNIITLSTTDGNNFLYVYGSTTGEDFDVCVDTKQFFKLIPKLTSDTIIFENKNNKLIIKGSGKYEIPLPLDSMGNQISMPNKLESTNMVSPIDIDIEDVKIINKANKNATLKTDEILEYTGFYFSNDGVISTDGITLAKYCNNIFNHTVLMSPSMFNLLTLYNKDFTGYIDDNTLVFLNDEIGIYGPILDGKERFQIDVINDLLNRELENQCEINVKDALDALSRLLIFVDNDFIHVEFCNDHIIFSTIDNINVESCKFISSNILSTEKHIVSITKLMSIFKQLTEDTAKIYYGQDKFIKVIENNIIQLLALGAE